MAMDETALAGLRVVELAGAEGAYCGKLLADMGAELVKIEPPAGAQQRYQSPYWHDVPGADNGLSFLYHNTSKKSLVLDLATEAGCETLQQLLRHADMLITTWSAQRLAAIGCAYGDLRAHNRGLIVCAISGFGQFGPYRDFTSSDLVASAMSGAMAVIGFADDPPVRLAGSQAYVVASHLAAIGGLVALHYRHHSGQGQCVDVSLQEAMLSASSICGVGKWLADDIVPRRFGTGLFAAVPSGLYHCRDGGIYLIVNRPRHWQVLARWVHEVTGNVEILDPMFEGPSAARQPYRELLDIYIGDLTASFSVDDFYREGQRRHLAVTPLHNATTLMADPHLQARAFFVALEHPGRGVLRYPGPPYRLSRTPWRMAAPAPAIGEHNGQLADLLTRWAEHSEDTGAELSASGTGLPAPQGGALAGVRVVEFTAGMAGPWIGRYLAWCGADVIKVESRDYPDVTRLYVSPREPELGVQSQLSPWFTDWNAGKRFVALDLTKPKGVELAQRLVAQCDIVIDNNANGVLDKLGLGFARLRAIKAELILFSSTGYGNTGPDASYISWGPNIETLSGLSALSGFAHRECTMTQFAYPDALSALSGLVAILSALAYRQHSGHGQTINLSQQEATLAALGEALMDTLAHQREAAPTGNQAPGGSFEGCYPCRGDDRWIVFTVGTDEQWWQLGAELGCAEVLDNMGLADVLSCPERRAHIDDVLSACTRRYEARELMLQLQRKHIPAGLVQNTEDQYLRDPHLQARGFFESVHHWREGEVVAPGIPLLFSETPGTTRDSGRAIGQDNQTVLAELLSIDTEQFMAYVDSGVIQQAD